ncbi:MAG: helix-turn-helix domain-containing protein [Acholeplasmatales bacterium]|nr:helix-turn-helix domain-containing protein [Acholeplasmatales bacterium]
MRIDNLYNMDVILKEIGRRIREYRIGLSITQNDFAKKVGVSTRTISSIENGLDTSFSTIIRVLDGLKLITNLNLLVPEKEEYIIQEHTEKKRYKKSNKKSEWKWGDEK